MSRDFERSAIRGLLVFILLMFGVVQVFESRNRPAYPKPRPLYNLAKYLVVRGQIDKAVPIYKELLANPRTTTDFYPHEDYPGPITWRDQVGLDLAAIYMRGGLLAKSEELLASLNPIPTVIANRAVLLLLQGRPEIALWFLDSYGDRCYQYVSCLFSYAQVMQALGNCTRGQQAYEQARHIDPFIPRWKCE